MNGKTDQDPLQALVTKLDEMEIAISGIFNPTASPADSAATKTLDNGLSVRSSLYASLMALLRGTGNK